MLWDTQRGQSDFCEPLRFLKDFGIVEHYFQFGDAEPFLQHFGLKDLSCFLIGPTSNIIK